MMKGPTVFIYKPFNGFLSLPANPFYDPRKDREDKLREMESPKDMASDYVHFCDACEKGFNAELQYRAHLNKHIWCDVPGCKFTCLKEKEWKMEMHKSTLHDRVDAPDLVNIGNYISARKKRFPTTDKILTKSEELHMLAARGGVLTRDQWRWLKAQENAQKVSITTESDHATPKSPESPPCSVGQRWPNFRKDGLDEEHGRGNRTHVNSDDSVDSASSTECLDTDEATDDENEKFIERNERLPEEPVQETVSALQEKAMQNRKSRIQKQRKRKLSLFEKLTMEDRVLEKGQVLQALRYFIATDFLQHIPHW